MNKHIEALIVFLTLAIMVACGMWYSGTIEPDKAAIFEKSFFLIVGAFITSVNYLVGSSAGSARKDIAKTEAKQ